MVLPLKGLNLSLYGLVVSGSILIFFAFTLKRASFYSLKRHTIEDLFLLSFPLGILGARLHHVFSSWSYYFENPLKIFLVWQGGLGFYGAVLAVAFGCCIYCFYQKISPLQVFDLLSPGLALAQGLGRWGNYLNQELLPYALYELIFDSSLFIFLLFLEKLLLKKSQLGQGKVFASYTLLYGFSRFFLEELREEPLIWMHNLNQWLSLGLVLIGIIVLLRTNVFRK